MTKPSPEATVGRATQLVNYLTSTARKVSSGLASSIRKDPYSAAVVGVGLAWLILQWWTRKNVATESSARKSNDAQSLGRAVSDSILFQLPSANATSGSQINGIAQHLADVAGARAQDFSQQAQNLGSQARERAHDLSGEIQETVRVLGDEAQDQVNDLRSNAQGQANRLSGDIQGTSQRLTGSLDQALRPNLVAVSARLSRGIRPVTKPS
jgi:gas vesicle protein